MKVLVTGGTGVVGEGAIRALLQRGHEVRVLSRNAGSDTRQWPHGVEPWTGDVGTAGAVNGAAEGCGAILHVAGIAAENPPDATFEKVNVGGTRHIVAEAQRAKVARLVFVSSLGADTGSSAYHRSKLKAEGVVRRCTRPWVILRPGNVYGPGDEVLSTLLKMVRALPAVPVVDDGRQPFQPVWYEDLGEALALAVDAENVVGRVLELAGTEVTTLSDVLDRMEALTGRKVVRVKVPGAVAAVGLQVAGMLGVPTPFKETNLILLEEENVIAPQRPNDLVDTFGIHPIPLDEGLRRLAGVMPEQMPSEGVGPMMHKRYWADIQGSYFRARALRDVFRREVSSLLPLETAREGGPPTHLRKHQTFSVTLPVRGVISMRVEDVTPERIVAATVDGHPLAGIVEFVFVERGRQVRFEVEVHARGADLADAVVMQTVGAFLQDVNWLSVVERVVERSGGTAVDGVQMETHALEDEEARAVEARVERLVRGRKRAAAPVPPPRAKARMKAPRRRAARQRPTTAGARSPRRSPGTGSARRSRAGTGSARTTGRAARRSGARKGSRRSS